MISRVKDFRFIIHVINILAKKSFKLFRSYICIVIISIICYTIQDEANNFKDKKVYEYEIKKSQMNLYITCEREFQSSTNEIKIID